MDNQYNRTKYNFRVKQISDHEIELTVDNINIKEYIERVLDDLILEKLLCYSYDTYKHNITSIYKIKGKKNMVTLSMFLIDQAMQVYRNLEFCALMQPYTDKIHTRVKL